VGDREKRCSQMEFLFEICNFHILSCRNRNDVLFLSIKIMCADELLSLSAVHKGKLYIFHPTVVVGLRDLLIWKT
jgi:hypothetical protein